MSITDGLFNGLANWHPHIHRTFQEPTMNETSRPSFVSLEVTKKHANIARSETTAEVSISDPTRKDVKAMVQLAAETIKEVLK